MYILRIVIIYSSKNHLKREQINKTEKGTVFRKDFLEGLLFRKRVGFQEKFNGLIISY